MEMKISDGIKVANQLTLSWGDYPGLSLWVGPMRLYGKKEVRVREWLGNTVLLSLSFGVHRCATAMLDVQAVLSYSGGNVHLWVMNKTSKIHHRVCILSLAGEEMWGVLIRYDVFICGKMAWMLESLARCWLDPIFMTPIPFFLLG